MSTPVTGHRKADHTDCECVEELDHDLYECDCPGYQLAVTPPRGTFLRKDDHGTS